MKTCWLGGLILIFSSSFATAASVFDKVTGAQPVCYGREYSAAALKARPKQTVQKILAKFSKDLQYHQNILSVELTLVGKKNYYTTFRSLLFCDQHDDCYVECDGGSVNVSLLADGRLLFKNHGFAIKGGCTGDDEEDGVMLPATPGGDDAFKMTRLPSAFCQKAPDYLPD